MTFDSTRFLQRLRSSVLFYKVELKFFSLSGWTFLPDCQAEYHVFALVTWEASGYKGAYLFLSII